MDRIYRASKQLQGQFEMLYKSNIQCESRWKRYLIKSFELLVETWKRCVVETRLERNPRAIDCYSKITVKPLHHLHLRISKNLGEYTIT